MNYSSFLNLVANWISQRAESNSARLGLVCEVMRNANEVWFGVGVYTVCEVLFLAGMVTFFYHSILFVLWLKFVIFFRLGVSPFLTEHEVFTNPSRTARICEAFWSYKHKSAQCLPCVFPCSSVSQYLSNSLKDLFLILVFGSVSWPHP